MEPFQREPISYESRRSAMKANFRRSLIAVLAGNLIYYSVERYLPQAAQHQIYRIDWGLALDFWFCLVCYGLVKLIW